MAWAAVIWVFSTQIFAAHTSSRFIFPLLHLLFPDAAEETLHFWHAVIRKTAHVLEYFIFSLLLLRGVRGDRAGWRPSWGATAVALATGYAALDEMHQAFVPARGASVYDVLLDSAGAAAAQLLAAWGPRAKARPVDNPAQPALR